MIKKKVIWQNDVLLFETIFSYNTYQNEQSHILIKGENIN